jgi:NhaP-type Na+/H+ or K+/H+ antiporter
MDRVAAEHFEPLGDLLSEVTKFAALLVFGALITPDRLSHLGVGGWALAVLSILLVRPAAMAISLIRTPLDQRERAAAAWFGPKGFASVVYGLLVLQAGLAESEKVFDLVAVTIALSIVLHSSTDVPVARALRVEPPDNLPTGQSDAEPVREL